MEQTDIFYIAKFWDGSFHSLISGPWLTEKGAEGIKNALNDNKSTNKEDYEVVCQRIEVCIY